MQNAPWPGWRTGGNSRARGHAGLAVRSFMVPSGPCVRPVASPWRLSSRGMRLHIYCAYGRYMGAWCCKLPRCLYWLGIIKNW